jgi:hypothetical protein
MIFVMSKGLCPSFSYRFHVAFCEVGMGERGGMDVEGEDEGLGKVDEEPRGMGGVGGLEFLGKFLWSLGGSFFGVW